MTEGEKARAERARRLREEIGRLGERKPRPSPPRTPREFVEERMRELAADPKDDEEESDENPPGTERE